jgi:cytochrome c-type biogenesis protein CcsB
MYRKDKALVLMFHISFFIVLIGAAITRYAGYEGSMHIREGASKSTMLSAETYLDFKFDNNGKIFEYSKPLYLSKISENDISYDIDVADKNIKAEIIKYIPDAVYTLKSAKNGKPIANMMVTGQSSQPEQLTLRKGEYYITSNYVLDFESDKTFSKPVISIFADGDTLKMSHPMSISYLNMDDRSSGELNASKSSVIQERRLHTIGDSSFVLRNFYPSAKEVLVSRSTLSGPRMNNGEIDAIVLRLSSANESRDVTIEGIRGLVGDKVSVKFAGMNIDISYGAKIIHLPFALKLEKFDLTRYPGSNSPSSYASDVVLIDKEQNIQMPFRIYMNHVLDHRGYRFFQSSYDRDEKGTVLSVNHDPGTLPTYLGYLLMAIGMFGSLFMKNGRFAKLSKKAKDAASKVATATAILVFASLLTQPQAQAQELNPVIKRVLSFDKAHAEKFAHLLVQTRQGRMKPIDTLSTEILAKVSRKASLLGMTPNQVVLGMMLAPDSWREINMIHTADKAVNKVIGVDENTKDISFSQFFEFPSEMQGYKLSKYVEEAVRKAPGKRDKFDKAVLKIDERVNVCFMVYTGELISIWPSMTDTNNKWYPTIKAIQEFDAKNSEIVRLLALNWFNKIEEAIKSGDWSEADNALDAVAKYQRSVGKDIYVSDNKIEIEILYNKLNIFEKLWPFFFLIGFVLLILSFTKIVRPKFKLDIYTKVTMIVLIVFFIALTFGLAMRWYISGHAPWSDGYESMIYISWATMLAGFIFSKNSPITLAATGILTGLILFVAHLNWMDPQVTNLVPVLNSYWLSIHVSMITASYGFLGLGALLGFITLILFMIKNDRNSVQISNSIRELNAINEMSLMIGLAMLTIGNFLGGVWANESWGRYWGWDPKETWALVTILVYAVVVHVRFIKSIYTPFAYSVISLLAFTSVIMTYFGVNYYLAGMHSYAKGDPVPIPDFVPVSYAVVFIIIALAYRKRHLSK